MATRRIVAGEKTILEKDEITEKSDTSLAVPKHVLFKLLGFSLAMIVVPIGSYFATVNSVFNGNSTFAGGFAAIIANVVLIGYIIVAMREDQEERNDAKKPETKKDI